MSSIKNTPARVAIKSVFEKNKRPLSATELIDGLKKIKIKIDRVTVFRNINVLLKNKFIKRVEFNEGKYRYELSSLPHHHHLICICCKKIKDIKSDSLHKEIELLKRRVAKKHGFKIEDHKLEFFGRCKKCKK